MSAGDACDAGVVVVDEAAAVADATVDAPRLAGRKSPCALLRARDEAEASVPRLDCCRCASAVDAGSSKLSALNTLSRYVPVYWQRIVIGTIAASRVTACGAEKNST